MCRPLLPEAPGAVLGPQRCEYTALDAATKSEYSAEHAISGRMVLLARIDPDTARLYHERQQNRAAAMRDLAVRLRHQRKLRPRISVEAAAGVLWVLTGFETFDQLLSGWGLDATACGSQIVMMARAWLV